MGQVLSYNFSQLPSWHTHILKTGPSKFKRVQRYCNRMMLVLFLSLEASQNPPERTVMEGYVVDWGGLTKILNQSGKCRRCQRRQEEDSTCLKVRSTEAGKTWQFQEGEFYDWKSSLGYSPVVGMICCHFLRAVSLATIRTFWIILQHEFSGS